MNSSRNQWIFSDPVDTKRSITIVLDQFVIPARCLLPPPGPVPDHHRRLHLLLRWNPRSVLHPGTPPLDRGGVLYSFTGEKLSLPTQGRGTVISLLFTLHVVQPNHSLPFFTTGALKPDPP